MTRTIVRLLYAWMALSGWLTVQVVAQTVAAPGGLPTRGSSQGQASPVPTLRALSRLVIVDVVVTDAHRKAIHGLKQSDFTLTEGGAVQTVKNFEEHRGLSPAEAVTGRRCRSCSRGCLRTSRRLR